MHYRRRQFLHHTACLGAFSLFAHTGLIKSASANLPRRTDNFHAGSFEQTRRKLFKEKSTTTSDRIDLIAPDIAENGASVPVTISSDLKNISQIFLLVVNNPVPLSAVFHITPAVDVYLKARIKMAKTSDIVVIAESGEDLFEIRRLVKVTEGGCGG